MSTTGTPDHGQNASISIEYDPFPLSTAADIQPEYRAVIDILPTDRTLAEFLADDRVGSYDAGRTLNTRRGDLSDWEILFYGALFEVGAARNAGVDIDAETYDYGDDGDLKIRQTWDLKLIVCDLSSSSKPDPHLLVEEGEVHADRYLLGTLHFDDAGDADRIELLGQCDRDTVLAHDPKKWPADISNHAVPLSDMEVASKIFGDRP